MGTLETCDTLCIERTAWARGFEEIRIANALETSFETMVRDIERRTKLLRREHSVLLKQWLRKLHEQKTRNVVWNRNRNSYARLLLEQLRRGTLAPPFLGPPPSCPLPTLAPWLTYPFIRPRGMSRQQAAERPDSPGACSCRSATRSPARMRGGGRAALAQRLAEAEQRADQQGQELQAAQQYVDTLHQQLTQQQAVRSSSSSRGSPHSQGDNQGAGCNVGDSNFHGIGSIGGPGAEAAEADVRGGLTRLAVKNFGLRRQLAGSSGDGTGGSRGRGSQASSPTLSPRSTVQYGPPLGLSLSSPVSGAGLPREPQLEPLRFSDSYNSGGGGTDGAAGGGSYGGKAVCIEPVDYSCPASVEDRLSMLSLGHAATPPGCCCLVSDAPRPSASRFGGCGSGDGNGGDCSAVQYNCGASPVTDSHQSCVWASAHSGSGLGEVPAAGLTPLVFDGGSGSCRSSSGNDGGLGGGHRKSISSSNSSKRIRQSDGVGRLFASSSSTGVGGGTGSPADEFDLDELNRQVEDVRRAFSLA